jgi:hypothetical protein
MEAALQLFALIIAALLLNACATARVAPDRVARVQLMSDEVSCMADCLDDGSETCDSCAADCLEQGSGARVASGE